MKPIPIAAQLMLCLTIILGGLFLTAEPASAHNWLGIVSSISITPLR